MRFYVSPESVFLERNVIEIRDREEFHHIRDVMRLKQGMNVSVFDGRGKAYLGEIKSLKKDLIIIAIREILDFRNDSPYKITLYQTIPKKNKMDLIVEKAVELGVDTIVPIITERTIVSIKEKSAIKRERWDRVAKAASKQCGRTNLPLISNPVNFRDALIESKNNDLIIFAALCKEARPLKAILKDLEAERIAVFIGPEGDFSEKEIAMAKKEGFNICSLGTSVFKVETAAIYILSCLNYEYTN